MQLKFITKDKSFAPLFWTQFSGAFNDNLFKNALVVIILFKEISILNLPTSSIVALSGGIFILPFFLFSPLAGQLSDKYEKSQIIRATKIWEILIMTMAAIGFLTSSYAILLFVLFLMGTQSTFFGPIKYSIVPDLVETRDLTEANAYIELGTFIAILLGTILGGLFSSLEQSEYIISAGILVTAISGYLISRKVISVPTACPELKISINPFPEFLSLWRLICRKTVVFNSVLGISWFWFFGAGILSILPIFVKDSIGGDETVVSIFLAMFTLGIGLGSIICEKLSFKRVELGLVPIGSLGMTLFLIDLYFQGVPTVLPNQPMGIVQFLGQQGSLRILMDFFAMSIFGGLFIVPLYTLIQERGERTQLSRIIAANNILNALFMVISSVLLMGLYQFNFSPTECLLIFAILNAIVAIYIYGIVPEFTLRFYSWILAHTLYSTKVKGAENIPQEGPVVLAPNHVSFVDWLLLYGVCKRPIRFVMYYKFFKIPILKTLFKQARIIPIAGAKEDPQIMKNAFDRIAEELNNGEVICIFPEGQITKNGELSQFKPGIKKVVDQNQVSVVPVVLNGLWGSVFSKNNKKDIPHRRRLSIEFLTPILPQSFRVDTLQKVIEEKIQKS